MAEKLTEGDQESEEGEGIESQPQIGITAKLICTSEETRAALLKYHSNGDLADIRLTCIQLFFQMAQQQGYLPSPTEIRDRRRIELVITIEQVRVIVDENKNPQSKLTIEVSSHRMPNGMPCATRFTMTHRINILGGGSAPPLIKA